MPQTRIAVAVIHGMGSQGEDTQGIDQISFSAKLYESLKDEMGAALFEGPGARIGYREVFWADILQSRQEEYVGDALTGKGARWMDVRRFVMHNLADAAAFRKSTDPNDTIYTRIHRRVFDTVKRLEEIVGPGTPLVVLAHSLGGHIMSCYIYDMMHSRWQHEPETDFQRLHTMCGFVTFGCNIPVFTFNYAKDDVEPISYPGALIPATKRFNPWWLNLNDKDDALGMPLADLSAKYKAMETAGELDDRWINVGDPLTFWNPISHARYWDDRHFYKPVAAMLRKALKIGPV